MTRARSRGSSQVDQFRWRQTGWFKVRVRLAPSFAPVENVQLHSAIPTSVENPTPKVDLLFPPVRVDVIRNEEFRVAMSADLGAFETIAVHPIALTVIETVPVSGDLFVPLGPSKSDGRQYAKRRWSEDEQLPLFPALSRDKDGYRKSFTKTDDRTTTIMVVWDLILPLLEPPLSLEFPEFIDLPSPLRPYQVVGVKFLLDRNSALLGDDMGIGKTVQTIVAMRILFQNGSITSALIVVPLVVLKNWDRELLKWAPLLNGVTVVRGPKGQRDLQWEKPAHVWVSTFGTIRSDIDHIKKHRQFDLVVLDEIQAIKNAATAQTQAIKRLPRKRAWGLSGTPIENELNDLVSIFDFLKPGLLRGDGLTPDRARKQVEPFFLRRRKKDVLGDLPDKKAFDVWLALEEQQREAYDRALNEGRVWLQELGNEITVTHVLQLLQKLKMLCNRHPQTGQSSKLDLLDEKLEEAVSEGSKALVYSQYLDEGVTFIAEHLKQYNPAVITGRISGSRRDREIERFQGDSECKVFVATQKSGGVGLNLIAGNYVFHFDHWWNPATGRQAEDRVHRIGQTRDVFVYHFWTEDTVEERIYRILERKQQLYDDVIEGLSNVESSGLSEEELFGLFDLEPPRRGAQGIDSNSRQDAILRQLLSLTPEAFEGTVARLYEAFGYGTRITPVSRDAGVDVVASRNTAGGGGERLAIQCKRYEPDHRVGRPVAQALLGVLTNDRSFTKGILITTSSFTGDCRDFVRGHGNLELIDGKQLAALIKKTNLDLQ